MKPPVYDAEYFLTVLVVAIIIGAIITAFTAALQHFAPRAWRRRMRR